MFLKFQRRSLKILTLFKIKSQDPGINIVKDQIKFEKKSKGDISQISKFMIKCLFF